MNITIHCRLIKGDAFIEKCSTIFLHNGYRAKNRRFEDFLMLESFRIANEFSERDPLGGVKKYKQKELSIRK